MQIIKKNKKFTMVLTLLMKQVLKGMNWKNWYMHVIVLIILCVVMYAK